MSDSAKAEIPLFPLNTVLFPGGPLSLRIFEPRYVDMVRRCMREGLGFGVLLMQRAGSETMPDSDVAVVGTLARIEDFYSCRRACWVSHAVASASSRWCGAGGRPTA